MALRLERRSALEDVVDRSVHDCAVRHSHHARRAFSRAELRRDSGWPAWTHPRAEPNLRVPATALAAFPSRIARGRFGLSRLVGHLLISNFVYPQKPGDLLKLRNGKIPEEKIHLHFDKDVYVSGETMWYKAYLMNGLTIDTLSTSLFIELSDPSGKIIMKQALPILESTATGNFDLPDSLKAGNYSIRAYTTWMLNFENEFLLWWNFLLNIFRLE